jgi:alkanesulfonate monooxygenase SsuD/methylene tetrahydromethanopterin reductase-like flavin-dependent oxidoreductase (luciferase family)
VIARARRAERDGFDVISYADLVVGDPFPPLMLAAQATERIGLMTRLVGAFSRSPIHLASAAAWVDQVSGGRFMLGLGASLRRATRDRLGYDFDRPAARMRDVIQVIRTVGESAGETAYRGEVLAIPRAGVDLAPARRLPILLAAAGPRMLRLAGALADGIILELTTPAFLRWALDRVREGADEVGRTLDGFDVCVQGTFLPPAGETPPITATRDQVGFYIRHCVDPEFAATWREGGPGDVAEAIRAAAGDGDQARAETLVREQLFPAMAVDCADPDSFWRWLDGHVAAGATIVALPLEIEELIGVSPRAIKARAPARA